MIFDPPSLYFDMRRGSYMAAAKHRTKKMSSLRADAPTISHYSGRAAAELAEEIDRLRKVMTDTFLQERSLVADSVMELSRQLDRKINEYMKVVLLSREQAR